MKADYYVTPKKLRPYDLKSAHQLTEQPVWVKVGYYHTYYPYNAARTQQISRTRRERSVPLQKLAYQGCGRRCFPQGAGDETGDGDI